MYCKSCKEFFDPEEVEIINGVKLDAGGGQCYPTGCHYCGSNDIEYEDDEKEEE